MCQQATSQARLEKPPTWAVLMCVLRDQAPVANLVSDGVFVTRGDGALQPSDSLVDPIVAMRRIGLRFLATDCGVGYTLLALIQHVTRFTSAPTRPPLRQFR
jgi:hypothetical protein